MQGCGVCEYDYGICAGCPNCNESVPKEICSICGEGIYSGEDYVENDYGGIAHWECVYYRDELEKFFDIKIKTMDGD